MLQLKNMLIPTDFSESAMSATQHALALARPFGARVHLLYVIDEPSFQIHGFGGYIPGREEFEAYGDAGLRHWIEIEDEAGLEIVRAKEFGRTSAKIVEYAREQDIDIIVMGTNGRSPIMRGLLGSVAERVMRHAPCPVLTIHPDARRFIEGQDTGTAAVSEIEGSGRDDQEQGVSSNCSKCQERPPCVADAASGRRAVPLHTCREHRLEFGGS